MCLRVCLLACLRACTFVCTDLLCRTWCTSHISPGKVVSTNVSALALLGQSYAGTEQCRHRAVLAQSSAYTEQCRHRAVPTPSSADTEQYQDKVCYICYPKSYHNDQYVTIIFLLGNSRYTRSREHLMPNSGMLWSNVHQTIFGIKQSHTSLTPECWLPKQCWPTSIPGPTTCGGAMSLKKATSLKNISSSESTMALA